MNNNFHLKKKSFSWHFFSQKENMMASFS